MMKTDIASKSHSILRSIHSKVIISITLLLYFRDSINIHQNYYNLFIKATLSILAINFLKHHASHSLLFVYFI